LRGRVSSAVVLSLTILTATSGPAFAGTSGGVAGGTAASGSSPSTSKSSGSASHKLTAPPHAAPITARSSNLAYKGPVYQKTASGEVIPYQPPVAPGQPGQASPTGGSPVGVAADAKPQLLVPGSLARYVNGLAAAPMSAPAAVQEVLWAGNQIVGLPYIFGGGHASFESPGYDCSGTVSFALHGASLLAAPADSSELESWGSHGIGRWITIFSNPGHAYVDVAGLRLDTSAADDPSDQQGPRWRPLRLANGGYTIRHPLGL
jgi:hypothetical protein